MKDKKIMLLKVRKENLKKKLGEKCVYCGCTNKLSLTIDHKVPLSRGGKDTDTNKQVCCFICNQLKDSLKHGEFIEYMKALNILKKLNKVSLSFEDPKLRIKSWHIPYTEKEILELIEKDAVEEIDGK